jgi:glucose-1-phosphate adenylyltransferase
MEVSPQLLEEKGVRADQPYLASMGIYLFRKQALLEALDNNLVDFGGDVIPAEVGRRRVQAHFFKGYWRDIGTIRAFFDAHMDLVQFNPPFSFHDRDWPIYTRPRHLPGARLDGCCFARVLLGDGSRVVDSKVEDSVVGLRSSINGATLKRALVMGVDNYYPKAPAGSPPVGIGEDSLIENAIIDKNARIGRNVRIVNTHQVQEAEGDGWVIHDGIVVIPKNGIIPDGTVI